MFGGEAKTTTSARRDIIMSRAEAISTSSLALSSSEVRQANEVLRQSLTNTGLLQTTTDRSPNGGTCSFVLDMTVPVQDNNLIGLTQIPSRSYILRFAVYPEGLVAESETNVIAVRSSGVEVPGISFLKNSTELQVKFGITDQVGFNLHGPSPLPIGSWSLVKILIRGRDLSVEVQSSVSPVLSYDQSIELPARRKLTTSAAIYASTGLPAANAFIGDISLCAPAAPSTLSPSAAPSPAPTATESPTETPTTSPTVTPTISPTLEPTPLPSAAPTFAPSPAPTATESPTETPTSNPTPAYTIFVPSPTSTPTPAT